MLLGFTLKADPAEGHIVVAVPLILIYRLGDVFSDAAETTHEVVANGFDVGEAQALRFSLGLVTGHFLLRHLVLCFDSCRASFLLCRLGYRTAVMVLFGISVETWFCHSLKRPLLIFTEHLLEEGFVILLKRHHGLLHFLFLLLRLFLLFKHLLVNTRAPFTLVVLIGLNLLILGRAANFARPRDGVVGV